MPRTETTFAHLFQKAGYATCITGKWQLGKDADAPQHFGFDEACLWQHTLSGNKNAQRCDNRFANPDLDVNGKRMTLPEGAYGPDVCADFICDFMQKNRNRSFLVYYPMILTHCPFTPSPDSADWDPKSPGSTSYKGEARYFGDMVSYMDKIVGRIVAKVEALGVADDTLILFTGDNGTDKPVVSMMGDREVVGGKGRMSDEGTRVPLIAYQPGTVPGARVSQDLVDFSDFLPTLCEAADITVPSALGIDGRSFHAQLRGDAGTPRDWIYCWHSRSGGSCSTKSWARTQRYSLAGNGTFLDMGNGKASAVELDLAGLTPEVTQVHTMVSGVVKRHNAMRPEAATQSKSVKKPTRTKKKQRRSHPCPTDSERSAPEHARIEDRRRIPR